AASLIVLLARHAVLGCGNVDAVLNEVPQSGLGRRRDHVSCVVGMSCRDDTSEVIAPSQPETIEDPVDGDAGPGRVVLIKDAVEARTLLTITSYRSAPTSDHEGIEG